MIQRSRQFDLGHYWAHCVVVTGWLLAVPFIAVMSLPPTAGLWLSLLVALVLSLAAAAVGSAFWERRPASAEISFGELTLWGWLRRRRAESRLREDAGSLALEGEEHLGREERVRLLGQLAAALETKDLYTHGHSKRVEQHSGRMGAALDLPEWQVEELRRAAAVHDVGKIRVPDHILRKPGDLTAEERALLQAHPEVGAQMVEGTGTSAVVAAVRHHHERWDGRGYPDGRKGRDIPLYARIIAVADAYDAMTSTRPYRAGFSRAKASDVLRAEAGRQFDPEVVEAFLATLPTRAAISGLALPATLTGLGRRFGAQLRHAGATSAAPAVGAAGVAAMVVASSLSPLPAPPGEAETVRGPRSGAATGPRRPQTRVTKPGGGTPSAKRVGRAVVRGGQRARRGPRPSAAVATAPVAGGPAALQAPPEDPVVQQPAPGQPAAAPPPRLDPPSDGAGPPSGGDPAPLPPPPPPPEQAPPPGDDAGPPASGGKDPHPDKGRDCLDHPGNGNGAGSGKHCGG